MKTLLLITLSVFALNSYAARGIVLVLEAPLFKHPTTKSPVYQYVRKGKEIFIHNKHIDDSQYLTEREARVLRDVEREDDYEMAPADSSFYTTSDRIGRTAFILKEHVKIIYNDTRELSTSVSVPNDKMDYRLPEPIPETYPLISKHKHRTSISLGMETTSQTNYPYQSSVESYDYDNKYALGFSYLKRAKFDHTDRFYFGLKGAISYYRNSYLLDTGLTALEVSNTYELGPFISYDFFKGQFARMSFHGGFLFNYHLMKIVQDSDDNYRDRQNYDGFFLSPFLGGSLAINNVYGSTDLIFGSDIKFVPPHSLKTKGVKYEDALWSEKDEVSFPAEFQVSLYLGLQTNF